MTDPSVFAVLPEGRCCWAVASIFGQVGRLVTLHTLLDPRIAAFACTFLPWAFHSSARKSLAQSDLGATFKADR